ncbi:MAG: hypothetical protein ACXVHB_31115 [Solirubrobacteraceae bacterium]
MSYGRIGAPLQNGLASVVTASDGTTDIGSWHQEVPTPGRRAVSVRQNLNLLIDHGMAGATFSWSQNGRLLGGELRRQLQPEPGVELELDVLSPVMASRLHHWAGDVDRERKQAQVRLDASLAWAVEQGFVAKGEVGDVDAMGAIEDELRDLGADEVVIVTHPSERTSWLANRMLSHLKKQLEVPVREIVMGEERDGSSPPSTEPAG